MSAGSSGSSSNSTVRTLTLELKKLQQEPVEGFIVNLATEDNLFEWEVAIFGPPQTLYEGGYFKARLKFPSDYPYAPPSMRFMNKVWHPNVYENGDLCISILHPPVDDPHSGELASERWNPTQNVRTILLSVVSLLNEPNTSSPANVDASVMYRRWKDTNGIDEEYAKIVRKQVDTSAKEAEKDGVEVPRTIEAYCVRFKSTEDKFDEMMDFDDCYDFDDSDYQDSDIEDDEQDDSNEAGVRGSSSKSPNHNNNNNQTTACSSNATTTTNVLHPHHHHHTTKSTRLGASSDVTTHPHHVTSTLPGPGGDHHCLHDDNEDSGQGEL